MLIFTKIIGILFLFCRSIYYSNEALELDFKEIFETLINANIIIENLCKLEDRKGMKESKTYRIYLMSLGFCQEKFRVSSMNKQPSLLHSITMRLF